MKHSKKILTTVILLFATIALVSCKKNEVKAPVITGAANVTIEVGTPFDAKAGVKATDEVDGDLTDKIVITGEVNVNVVNKYTLTYTVTNKAEKEAKVTRVVDVVATRLYANGDYNYKFADYDLRNSFFGAAEGYLLDNVYGGVPLFTDAGMSIYSPRIILPVEEYVPVIGWGGLMYGSMDQATDDSKVPFSDGTVGKAGEYTYRGAFTSNPTTFSQWLSDDSVSSDAISFMVDSLYNIEYNADKTGYAVVPSMASEAPKAIGSRKEGTQTVSKKWQIPIREGLKFGFHENTNLAGFEEGHENINAQTFVDTFKYAIDQSWFRAIGGGSHFWSTSTPIKGAKAYFDGTSTTAAAWENVGIKAVDGGQTLELEFEIELSQWNVEYWLSSNTMSPVHKGLVEREGAAYGTKPETTAFTGPYILQTYEADKVLKYVKNTAFHSPTKYNYTGYNFAIIERAEMVFSEFEAGKLDAAGIPLTKYEQYKNNAGVRRSPGTTTFRMNINGLGTAAAQAEKFPNSNWKPVAILNDTDFRKALYFGIDRKTLALDILKTRDPGMFLFSSGYLVDAESGVAFRETEQGKAIGEKLSADTYGFNPDAASALFKNAVKNGVANGTVAKGTEAAPTVIKLELAVQAASQAQAQMGDFIKRTFENGDLYYDQANHVKIEITVQPVAFPDIYYTKQLVGNFDLGTGGISGSSLDAAGFLEVFTSDNRGGFTLNWGFDTSVAEIPVTYVKPGTQEVITEYWSFDAIVSVLNGPITVRNGEEVLDLASIAAVEVIINALPAASELTIKDLEAVEAAENAYWSLSPRAQDALADEVVTKLSEALDAMAVLVDIDNAAKFDAAVVALPATITVEDEKEFAKVIEAYKAIEDLTLVTKEAEFFVAYAALIDALTEALPTPLTLEDKKAVDAVVAYNTELEKFVGKDEAGVQIPTGVTTKAERDAAVADIKALVEAKAVVDFIALVDALDDAFPEGHTYILTDRYVIADARAAYKGLAEAKLTEANVVEALGRLVLHEAGVKHLIDEEAALLVNLTLVALPEANDVQPADAVLVLAARESYEALSAEGKALVEEANLAKLVELEEVLGLTEA